ncbi:transglutaminase-like cysteine peptidase [Magnetospira thiophila]
MGWIVRLAALGVAASLSCAVAQAFATPALFGSTETVSTDLKPFPKWTGTLDRYFAEKQKLEGDCADLGTPECRYSFWFKMMDEAKELSGLQQLNKVNGFLNKYKYVVDPINWGSKDYWAIPQEFFNKFGDCEDYAIAKYLTLRALGWPTEKMRIVVLRDLNLDALHAVLAVEFEGQFMILDNQISLVVDSRRILHYEPIFSINEQNWWRHRGSAASSNKSPQIKLLRKPGPTE